MFKSRYSVSELTERWDRMTSSERFAGADKDFDLIYVASRKGSRITLARRTSSYQALVSVFRGRIVSDTDGGSRIEGFYTKHPIDYVIFGAIFAVYFAVCSVYLSQNPFLPLPYALFFLGCIGVWLTFRTYSGAKKRYSEFIRNITGEELDDNVKPSGYQFRF